MRKKKNSAPKTLKEQAFDKPTRPIYPEWYDHFFDNKSAYYRQYYIPKTDLRKKIEKGYSLPYSEANIPDEEKMHWRKICAPVDVLKTEQRAIRNILYGKNPSRYDHCIKGKNRYTAMECHAGKDIMIAIDIKDAFPSVSLKMIRFMLRDEGYPAQIEDSISHLATLHDKLPQGSPCSPVILNLVRKTLDGRLAAYIRKRYNGSLTVYVDNYFISSSNRDMNQCIPVLKEIAKTEGFVINNRKIYVMRRGKKMNGLGLVVSEQDNGSKTVQPDKKYRDMIRATLHSATVKLENGESPRDDFDIERIRGMVETTKGTVYYDRFKDQIKHIKNLMSSGPVFSLRRAAAL